MSQAGKTFSMKERRSPLHTPPPPPPPPSHPPPDPDLGKSILVSVEVPKPPEEDEGYEFEATASGEISMNGPDITLTSSIDNGWDFTMTLSRNLESVLMPQYGRQAIPSWAAVLKSLCQNGCSRYPPETS